MKTIIIKIVKVFKYLYIKDDDEDKNFINFMNNFQSFQ
jgi:hypothetical protein